MRRVIFKGFITISIMLYAYAGGSQAALARLTPVTLDQFFVEPGQPTTLTWKTETTSLQPYRITDYWNHQVAVGQTKKDESGMATVRVRLPPGFYQIDFPNLDQRFGIDAIPPFKQSPDPFFSIDTAMSWLVHGPPHGKTWYPQFKAVRHELVHVLKRSGIGTARERVRWQQINPASGKWSWETWRDYDSMRTAYRDADLKIIEMFQDSPDYLGHIGKYPKDLLGTARAWKQIAKRWHTAWGAVEVWNEPNLHFSGFVPPDQNVPLVATLSQTLHAQYPKLLVGGGTVAGSTEGLPWLKTAAGSGLLNMIDFFSFHTYRHAPSIESDVRAFREVLKRFGRPNLPLWITESGRSWTAGSPRPSIHQDQVSALDITMKAIEARACGIARYFPFVYTFWAHRTHNFGMMGRDGTPLRSFAAYAYAIHALAHTRYIGDLHDDDPAIVRTRVFTSDDSHVIVIVYTGQAKSNADVELNVKPLEVRGIDGRILESKQAGRIPIPDGLSYVYVDRAAVKDRLNMDTSAMKLYRMGITDPKPSVHSPIVLQFLPDTQAVRPTLASYVISRQADETLPITIQVTNLGVRAHDLSLTLNQIPTSDSAVALSKPRQMSVAAQSSVTVRWQINPSTMDEPNPAQPLRLQVSAVESGHAQEAPLLLITLKRQPTLQALLQYFIKHRRLAIDDLDRWQPNAVAGSKTSMAWRNDAWRLTFDRLKAADNWVYPRFQLTGHTDLAHATGLIVRGRCRNDAHLRLFLWETQTSSDTGVGYRTPSGGMFPADGQWHSVFVPFTSFKQSSSNDPDPNGHLDLDQVKAISIGMNSMLPKNTLEISDVYVVEQ